MEKRKEYTRVICIVLILLLFALNTIYQNYLNTKTSSKREVATVNGVKIYNTDMQDELKTAEKTVINKYVDTYLLDNFYKDVTVTDAELEAEFTVFKSQVGDTQWEDYLNYMGYASEDALKSDILTYLKRVKLLQTKYIPKVEITETELKEVYAENPDNFNILTVNIVVPETTEQFEKAKTMQADGNSLEQIAESLGLQVKTNEHVYFVNVDGLYDKDIHSLKKGDTLYTNESTSTMYVGTIVKVDNTFEVLKGDIKTYLTSNKASKLLDADLETFYNNAKVTVNGEQVRETVDKQATENVSKVGNQGIE